MRKVHIIGGGTVSHVRTHLALCAPAYGETARRMHVLATRYFPTMAAVLHLTKMAGGGNGAPETNEDVAKLVERLVADLDTKVIFFNPALVDYEGSILEQGEWQEEPSLSGKYEPRLQSRLGEQTMRLTPADKLIGRIREKRKDITLVGFKTTSGMSEDDQYIAGLRLLKGASCNLVLANDTKTRMNMIITPEEARYHVTANRQEAIENLMEMAALRSHLTFTRSTVVAGSPVPWTDERVPASLRQVVDYCIQRGAYKLINGKTAGHFAVKLSPTTFLTSRRKTNFNDLANVGLVYVETDGPDSVIAYGSRPSVGGQSQRIIFREHQDYDCIVHFHCPKREGSPVPSVSQREYECGSHECGQNTSNGLKDFLAFDDAKGRAYRFSAVYLDNHGPNIVFNRNVNPELIIQFIEKNFNLSAKTGGYLPEWA